MEGDVITLQDVFLWDGTRGLRRRGPDAGPPRARPACARSSWRRWPTPTSPSTRCSSPRSAHDHRPPRSAARALGRAGRGRRSRSRRRPRWPPTARSRTSRPTPGAVQVLVSVPADADVDLDGVTVTVDGKAADGHGRARRQRHRPCAVPPSSRSTPASRWRAAASTRPRPPPGSSSTRSPTTSTSASSPSPARSPRPCTPTTTATRPGRARRARRSAKQTRLYDGVIQAVDVAGDRGPAQPARALRRRRHQRDPDRGRPPRRSRTPRSWSTSSRSSSPARRSSALQQLATAGQGQVISVRPGGAAGGVRRRGRRPGPPGAGHRARCRRASSKTEATIKVTLPTSAGSVTAEAFSSVEPGRAPQLAAGRPPWTPPSLGARTPARWRSASGWSCSSCWCRARRGAAQRRGPGRRRTPTSQSRRREQSGGPLLDTDVTFASAKETAANVLRRNKDLDARISARLAGRGQRAQVLGVAAAARRAVLRLRPGRPAAGRRQPAHRLRCSSPPACSDRGCTSGSSAAAGARRSTPGCPTRCS